MEIPFNINLTNTNLNIIKVTEVYGREKVNDSDVPNSAP